MDGARIGWLGGMGLGAGLAALLSLAGCDDTLFGVSEEVVDPGLEGYAGVQQIVADDCLLCHSTASAPSAGFGLDLEADLHANTVGVTGSYGVPLVTP
ncbi:MAG: hypothetical protein R3F59_38910, partial [Myxococcota bacterium]